MCGLWASIGAAAAPAALAAMAHRGPDGEGLLRFELDGTTVVLGHRRLAIIDTDARAAQPMTSADRRWSIIFNGAIYNYLELKRELEIEGCQFATSSDTEVLLHALIRWGEGALTRLVGMFTFILLDRENQELLVARDPFGIKPLFFARTAHGFAFASEIQPLLDYPGVSRRAEPTRVYRYLVFGQTDGDAQTMFADIANFPAAHFVRIRIGDVRPQWRMVAYWQPRALPGEDDIDTAAARVQRLLLDSVRLHLRSDVPLGAALSGGIDSSSIVAAMRSVGGPDLALPTFSFVAPGSSVDESRWVAMLAAAVGADMTSVTVSPSELAADLDRLVALQGEPFGSTSIYAQYRVMKLAHEHGIKVMLDGQGADELFAGYRPYLAVRLGELMRHGDAIGALRFLGRAAALPGTSLANLAMRALGDLLPAGGRAAARVLVGRSLAPDWLDRDWLRARDAMLGEGVTRRPRASLHDHLMESLSVTVLPALLRYEDRNSMAFSIEARVPFLTTAMAEAAYACRPEHLIAPDGTTKAVLRKAMRGLVPDAILERRDKVAFATPERAWLSNLRPWIEAALASPHARAVPVLRLPALRARMASAASGRDEGDFTLWRCINLLKWSEMFDVTYD